MAKKQMLEAESQTGFAPSKSGETPNSSMIIALQLLALDASNTVVLRCHRVLIVQPPPQCPRPILDKDEAAVKFILRQLV
jgi:hypothetical protein